MKHYCIIGYPLGHSLSPKIHNHWFRFKKIHAHYEACEVKPKHLAQFMRTYREKFAGGNITIPHKEKIMRFLDAISPEVRDIGAVNTIVNKNGMLIGYNTDIFGFLYALKKVFRKSLRNKKVIVLGAGGASRAIMYGLKKNGAHIVILNRTISHAKKLARIFTCTYGSLDDFNPIQCDILINATSVGMMKKGESPIPSLKEKIKNIEEKPLVMDIVYRPRMTKFLHDAKSAGCKIITGDKMLLAQAAKSFQLWNGQGVTALKILSR